MDRLLLINGRVVNEGTVSEQDVLISGDRQADLTVHGGRDKGGR